MKKTINFSLFIYVTLTTIFDVSAKPQGPVKKFGTNLQPGIPDLGLSSVIFSSKYVQQCSKRTSDNVKTLPDFNIGIVIDYLCTGISETVDRICELKLIDTSLIDVTRFENDMENSRLIANNSTEFCSAMRKIIASSSYRAKIDTTTHPNIFTLNENLLTGCNNVCWFSSKNSVNTLCIVLFWANGILAHTETSESVTKHPKPKTLLLGNKTENLELIRSQSPHKNLSLSTFQFETQVDIKKNEAYIAKISTTTAKTTPSSNNGANKDLTRNHQKSKDHMKKQQSFNDDHRAGSTQSKETQDIKNTQEEKQDKLLMKMDTDDHFSKNVISGEIEGDVIGDQGPRPEAVPSDDDGEDLDTKAPQIINSSPIETKKIISNPTDHIAASSNQDEEDKSSGQAKTTTNQESIAPQDNSLIHSGPPVPPQHFFAYFMAVSFTCLVCYIGYHKKHKILAIIFEGRKSRGGRGRRRPNTAGYRKLDCNLEEAVTSQCNSNVTHVIY